MDGVPPRDYDTLQFLSNTRGFSEVFLALQQTRGAHLAQFLLPVCSMRP